MKKLTNSEFISKSNIKHSNRYDYSRTNYTRSQDKVIIICEKHGEFSQVACEHLRGRGCPKCANEAHNDRERLNIDEFISRANKMHDNRYYYSKVNYKNNKIKICIICPKHGEFWQRPQDHLRGWGCSKCSNKNSPTTEEWIKYANTVHNNLYDYSKVEYKGAHKKVCIICPEHGEFWQKPSNHITNSTGCPICNSSKGEKEISKILSELNMEYEQEFTFNDCKFKDILPFDFYIPSENLLIEYDGIQHFEPINYFGGEDVFNIQIERDNIKNSFAKDKGIQLLRIPYHEFDNIEKILKSTLTLTINFSQ